MFRSIAKWYVSRAIDCNEHLPAWVERRLARDRELKQFYDQSRRLAARLQAADANTVLDVQSGEGKDAQSGNDVASAVVTASENRSDYSSTKRITFAIGLAAVLLLMILPYFRKADLNVANVQLAPDQAVVTDAPSESTGSRAERGNEAIVEAERSDPKLKNAERLQVLFNRGQQLVEGLKEEVKKGAEPPIETNYDQILAMNNLEFDQIVQPVSDWGAGYGRLLSQVDSHLENENRQLISEGLGAWNFFVQKLPKSAASLAGL